MSRNRARLERIERERKSAAQPELIFFECGENGRYTSESYPGESFTEQEIDKLKPANIPPGALWCILVNFTESEPENEQK